MTIHMKLKVKISKHISKGKRLNYIIIGKKNYNKLTECFFNERIIPNKKVQLTSYMGADFIIIDKNILECAG